MRAKNSIFDLAILGGEPLLAEMLHVGRPNVLDPEGLYARIRGAVERKWLSNDGPLVLELEHECARFLGVKHCVAIANATFGLQLLLEALEVKGGVLMPSLTFIGTAHAAKWQGATPVFCEVLGDKHTLDPVKVREAMTPDIRAILGVHLWGRACEIDELQAIADEWRVPLLFDAAHALGSSYRGARIGGFGNAEVFSLHATKAINGLEGGLVATNDDGLAQRIRASRNFGFTGRIDAVEGLGTNAKMNEFSAAMALSNLGKFEELAAHNRKILDAYSESLAGLQGVRMASNGDSESCHYAVMEFSGVDGLTRDTLLRILMAENVHARRYFWPGCHRSAPYGQQDDQTLPTTERLTEVLVQLPTGMQMNQRQASEVGGLIRFCVEHAGPVNAAIEQ